MGKPRIAGVRDTAFMVAAWRAAESNRSDALFRDPYAGRLAGARGHGLAQHLAGRRFGQWEVVVRTAIIDEMIAAAVRGGVGTVLNLGAGLDTRPYRLTWPASLRWVEVDFPDLLGEKEERLCGIRPTCRLERADLDVTDAVARRALLDRLSAESPATLVVTEGLVPYLANEAVGALAEDLRRLRGVRWIVDYFSRRMMRLRRNGRVARQMEGAPFRFDPVDWFAFFENLGWRPLDVRDLIAEGRRLGRPVPVPTLRKLLMRARRLLWPPRARHGFKNLVGYALLSPRSEKDV